MVTEAQVCYLVDDVILNGVRNNIERSISLTNETIELRFGSNLYTENIFNFEHVSLEEDDFSLLDLIVNQIEKSGSVLDELQNSVAGIESDYAHYLKTIQFFANEHYLVKEPKLDEHKRMTSDNVHSDYLKYLELPIVDILILLLFKKLNTAYEMEKVVNLTCDYDHINFWNALGAWGFFKRQIKNLLRLQITLVYKETASFINANDSLKWNFFLNDSMFYDPKNESFSVLQVKNIAFMLVKKDDPTFDIDNNFKINSFKQLYKSLTQKEVKIGIHPNYQTSSNPALLKEQIHLFEDYFKATPKVARMHYLKLQVPDDFQLLADCGIRADYTYCFADNLLFRGGRAKPIKLWNSRLNKSIDIQSVPLSIMDNVLDFKLHLGLDESLQISKRKIVYSIAFGSSVSLLWHNTSMYRYHYPKNFHPELYGNLRKYILELDDQLSHKPA